MNIKSYKKGEGNKKIIRKNNAVSEILSTVLLLGIAASVIATLFFSLISKPEPGSPPLLEVSGKFIDNKLILTHHGGEAIDINSEVVLLLGGKSKSMFVGDFLDDEDKKKWILGFF